MEGWHKTQEEWRKNASDMVPNNCQGALTIIKTGRNWEEIKHALTRMNVPAREVAICCHQFRGDDLVVLELDLAENADRLDFLDEDDRKRALRFVCRNAKRRFVAARNALRHSLSVLLEQDPRCIRFGYNEYGKPSILAPATDWQFNISHSEDKALLAFRRQGRLGVDIEKVVVNARIDAEDLAQRFFSRNEYDGLMSYADAETRLHMFYRIWTRKEAVVKGIGMGLSIPLNAFSVSIGETPITLSSSDKRIDPFRWVIEDVALGSAYKGALAVELISPRAFL